MAGLDFVKTRAELEREGALRVEPKDPVGTAWLDSRKRRADRKAEEDKAMRDAKARDRHVCRFPACEYMPKKPRIDAAHSIHRGMGGNPDGDRTKRELLIAFCFIHHRQWDLGEFDVEPLTDRIFDGPVAFTRAGESGTAEIFHAESTAFESEERNPSA